MLTSALLGDKRQDGFIPPKRPYSFEAMLDDILEFASVMLVDDARLSMWMPTANNEDIELAIPTHPCLEIVSVCVQAFNKCKSCCPSSPSEADDRGYDRFDLGEA